MRIEAGTIVRTVTLFVALVNQWLDAAGRPLLPFDDDTINHSITMAFTLAATAWAWWKNNSFTPEAIQADHVMEALKAKAAVSDLAATIKEDQKTGDLGEIDALEDLKDKL